MNMRLLGITLLVIMIIGGLVAGVFANGIQRLLTVPATPAHAVQGIPIARGNTPGTQKPPVNPVTAKTPVAGGQPIGGVVVAQDTFQRTDQLLWGTATDTRSWESDANSPNNQQVFSVTNMMGRIANGQGTLNAVLGPANSNAELVMSGSLNHFAQGNVNLGVVLRWQDTNNWYKLLIDGTNIMLLKRVNGVTKQLATAPFPATGGKLYSLRFRIVGAVLFARGWSSTHAEPANWTLTVNDTDLVTGQAGIRVRVRNDTVVNIASFVVTIANSGM